jgi:hypothetical protein
MKRGGLLEIFNTHVRMRYEHGEKYGLPWTDLDFSETLFEVLMHT